MWPIDFTPNPSFLLQTLLVDEFSTVNPVNFVKIIFQQYSQWLAMFKHD